MSSIQERLRWAESRMHWLLPLVAWLLVVAWRPGALGLYHDDWFTLAPLSVHGDWTFLRDQISRPLYALLLAIVRLALPLSAPTYQALLTVLVALSAAALGLFMRRLATCLQGSARAGRLAAGVTAAAWLLLPWQHGIVLWPTAFAAQLSVIGYSALGIAILSPLTLRRKLAWSLGLFLAISLISETFWLAWAPLLLLQLAVGPATGSRDRMRQAMVLGGALTVLQAILALQNRIWAALGVGVNRSLNPAWLDTAWLSLRLLPSEFQQSVLMWQVWAAMLVVLVTAAVGAAMRYQRIGFLTVLVSVALAGLGSIVIHAAAGYRLEATGIFSRTMLVVSVWFCLAVGTAICLADGGRRALRIVSCTSLVVTLSLLGASSVRNAVPWIKSWEFEQRVLGQLPVRQLDASPPGSFLLIDMQRPSGTVEGLEAFWDTTGAVRASYPALAARWDPAGKSFIASAADARLKLTRWDGAMLTQAWCNNRDHVLWSLKADADVYVWRVQERSLVKASPPMQFGCESIARP